MWESLRSLNIPQEEWLLHGDALVTQISKGAASTGLAPSELDKALAVRVYHLYLPIYFFCRERVRLQRTLGIAPVIGLSAPQGCGKTTLVDLLTDRFAVDGFKCVAVSFDDFYLRGAEQEAVAAAHRTNQLLQEEQIALEHSDTARHSLP